jgi:DNA-binding XRE family transcriptional regulator
MKNKKDVPDLIKELRDKLDLTQEQFAQKVGVTFLTINNWEKGTRTPHPFLFQKLLDIS